MNLRRCSPVALLIASALSLLVQAHVIAQPTGKSRTKWDYFVVSTPDFLGPFRGSDSTFRAPVPIDVPQPSLDGSRNGPIAVLEAIVGTDGKTRVERTLRTSGSKSNRRIREVVSRWRFEPARLDGQPVRVRLRVTVSNAHHE